MKWLRSTDICVKLLAKVNSLHKTVAYFESVWSLPKSSLYANIQTYLPFGSFWGGISKYKFIYYKNKYRKDSFLALRSRIVKNTRIEMSLNFLYVIINAILYLIYKKYQIKLSGLYWGLS